MQSEFYLVVLSCKNKITMKNLKRIKRQELKTVKGGGVKPPRIIYPTDENGYCSTAPYYSYCPKYDGCMTSEAWDAYCTL
jgi:hypothetical protein